MDPSPAASVLVEASSPPPLGPRLDAGGASFAVRSHGAEAVELCLFTAGGEETDRIPLARHPSGVWHGRVPGLAAGQPYGFRAHGPFRPREGWRFNPAKLLLDPYARAVAGALRFDPAVIDHCPERPHEPDPRDSAAFVPKSVLVEAAFDWGPDRPPDHPWEATVLYEAHVKGLTRLHPGVDPRLGGTYLGLAADPVIAHLRSLGTTAVELLPVAHSLPERHLAEHGRPNYWGYSPAAFFAPHAAYATGDDGRQVREFQEMVRRLHAAGIEVLLDVVFNHTAEGGTGGATLCWRGLDNPRYYRLDPRDPSRYLDFTGCGHTFDLEQPEARELVLDALRYWAGELHVDGFRFDLAPALARRRHDFDPGAPFLRAVAADPLLSRRKLIAEPWDVGPGGYRLGGFPPGWREWNDRFRDAARGFWRADRGRAGELAARLEGSRDLLPPARRGEAASVDFITCHDGFTLRDLVSYERKHNDMNGEDNRDGAAQNLARNWGVEGETADPAIRRRRERVMRSLLATLAVTAGVPMLGHGDELGRTQRGNNNPYCHDDPLTWVDWEGGGAARSLLAFARRAFALRPHVRLGQAGRERRRPQGWVGPNARHLAAADWARPELRALGHRDGNLLILFNGGEDSVRFALPGPGRARRWHLLLDSGEPDLPPGALVGPVLDLAGSALAILEARPPDAPEADEDG